jgi:hypothetical protein
MCKIDNIIKITTLILQFISVSAVVFAFIFDISVKRNLAKQAIIHDWYKNIIIAKLDETICNYFKKTNELYEKYCQDKQTISDINELKMLLRSDITIFHKTRFLIINDFLSIYGILNDSGAQKITTEVEQYEDSCIDIFEKSILAEKCDIDIYRTRSNASRARILRIVFENDCLTVNEIKRKRGI